ncbi:hypothetical protein OAH36_03150 [Verrucomicrobia bacterium]|jgi:uncharacterized protein involved in exopolysaccharide biosynthesis|nr:hypothetical protein [Verrucomicrobiota bacterium]MDA7667785.1 hypothetical protein [bacterium]MDB4798575.1 hypothetical protein [Verrucomicrobiota bacterium]
MKKLAKRLSSLFVCIAVIASIAFEVSKGFDRSYRATATLQVDHRYHDPQLDRDDRDSLVSIKDEVRTVALTLNNRPLMQRIILENELFNNASFTSLIPGTNSLETGSRKLSRAVHSEVIEGTRLVTMSVTFPEPTLAKNLANLIAKGYIKQQVSHNLNNNRSADAVLTNDIERLKIKLQLSDQELTDFRRSKNIYVPLAGQHEMLISEMRELKDQISETEKKEFQLDNDLEIVSNFGESPTSRQLRQVMRMMDTTELDLYDKRRIEQEWFVNRLVAQHGTEHPVVIIERELVETLELRINTLLLQHISTMGAQREELKQERAILETRAKIAATEMQALDKVRLEYNTLEREVKRFRTRYQSAIRRLEETDPSSGLKERTIVIVEEAHEANEITPRLVPRFAVSLGIGLAIGILPILGLRQIGRFFKKQFLLSPAQPN